MKEIIVEISGNCNLDCIMCGYGRSKIRDRRLMDEGLFRHIIDDYCQDIRTLRLNACGESTIHPNFKEMLRYARERLKDTDIKMFSNINYDDDSITDALIECGVQLIMSIDSMDPVRMTEIRRGSVYERIMHNFERLSEGLELKAVMMTLQSSNLCDLEELGIRSLEKGCHFFCNIVNGQPFTDDLLKTLDEDGGWDRLEMTYKRLHETADRYGLRAFLPDHIGPRTMDRESLGNVVLSTAGQGICPRFSEEICIHFDGSITPCGMFNPYVYGNISDFEDRQSLLCSGKYREFAENQKNDPYCKNCGCMIVEGVNDVR